MKAMVKRTLFTCYALALILCMQSGSLAAEPGFSFAETLRFTFPLLGTPNETVSFPIYSKDEVITNAEVIVQDIKDPDGQSRDITLVSAALKNTTVTSSGVAVTLTPDQRLFVKPGEYRITLFFKGKTAKAAVISATATPILVRPTAEINLEELKDRTIEVFRNFPFSSTSTTFRLDLQETTGKSAINALTVLGRGILMKDSKVLVPGKVEAKIVGQDGQAATEVSPSAAVVLEVKVSELEKAGAFDTNLVLNSPTLGGNKTIPLKLVVSDIWIWPLLAIALGVIGGYYTNYISNKWRPRQLNHYRTVRLKDDLENYARLVSAPEKAEKLRALRYRLRNAEESNAVGDAATVKSQLDQIEIDLTAFGKDEAKALADSQIVFKNLKGLVEVYQEQNPALDPTDEDRLQTILRQLGAVKRLLEEHRVDYANERLAETESLFQTLKRGHLQRFLDVLDERFRQLEIAKHVTPAEVQEVGDLKKTIQASLASNSFDDAQTSLGELRTKIDKIEKEGRGVRREGGPPSEMPAVPLTEGRPHESIGIDVSTPPEERTTDNNITFNFRNFQNLAQQGDKVSWSFGDGDSKTDLTISEAVTHRFKDAGDYEVTLTVILGSQDGEERQVSETVTVLKGKTETALEKIQGRILSSDKSLLVIALILASLTGLLFLYIGKPFGSLTDYLTALLWGFGIDNSVRGLASVMTKLTASGGA